MMVQTRRVAKATSRPAPSQRLPVGIWATYAAGAWPLVYGALGLFWATGGGGFPFGENDARRWGVAVAPGRPPGGGRRAAARLPGPERGGGGGIDDPDVAPPSFPAAPPRRRRLRRADRGRTRPVAVFPDGSAADWSVDWGPARRCCSSCRGASRSAWRRSPTPGAGAPDDDPATAAPIDDPPLGYVAIGPPRRIRARPETSARSGVRAPRPDGAEPVEIRDARAS